MARHSAIGRPELGATPQSELGGIACALAATFFFVLQDAGVKWLSAELILVQVLFLRSAFGLVFCAGTVAVGLKPPTIAVRRPWLMAARCVLNVVAWLLFFTGLLQVDLGTGLALFFTFPIFMTALSGPLLGEPVGVRRWGAVLVGFAGTLIILDPRGGVEWASLLIVGAAACWSLVAIMTRKLAATEDPFVILVYTLLSFVVLSAPAQFWIWQAPALETWGLLAVIAACGVLAQFLIITAYAKASPPTVAPFEYSAVIWAAVLGYVLWREVPDGMAAVGALVIVASGLYIVHREARAPRIPKS